MKFQSVLSSVFMLLLVSGCAAKEGDQDLWVFTSTWLPQICAEEQSSCCHTASDFMKTHLTIGDLVPTYTNGQSQESMCRYTYGTFTPGNINAANKDDLVQFWPVRSAANLTKTWSGKFQNGYADTPEYKWTCSGLDQTTYLQSALALAKRIGTPDCIINSIGATLETSHLRSSNVVLQCTDGYLARILTCWSQDSSVHTPVSQADCPAAIVATDSCPGETVKIRAFQ
ncbi:TPA: hypothetical protein N0F65_008834 [Lagenidium giganteum]|uniref:Uncharacterized protein n=1 Tax=Lagenidium giganteum TaxID=4803 RepID=A0AAV2YSV4_9STRA|nr:TPA: hypothetical protein N0F65_008834 [Lagenidium giganteum]